MPLVTLQHCEACQGTLSPTAKSCPHCGHIRRGQDLKMAAKVATVLVLIVVIAMLAVSIVSIINMIHFSGDPSTFH